MDGFVTVVVLHYADVLGYGAYRPGDVAGFERSVAEALIQERSVRRFEEAASTIPAPTANTGSERGPKMPVAEPTALATVPDDAASVTAPSLRREDAAARPYRETLNEPRRRTAGPWAKKLTPTAASSPRLAAAMTFSPRGTSHTHAGHRGAETRQAAGNIARDPAARQASARNGEGSETRDEDGMGLGNSRGDALGLSAFHLYNGPEGARKAAERWWNGSGREERLRGKCGSARAGGILR